MVNTSTVKQCWNYPALFKTPLSVSNNQISYRKKKDLLSRPNPHSQPQETRIKPIEGKQEHARALCYTEAEKLPACLFTEVVF